MKSVPIIKTFIPIMVTRAVSCQIGISDRTIYYPRPVVARFMFYTTFVTVKTAEG